MNHEKILALLVVLIVLLELVPIVSSADNTEIVISEIMANPLNETTDEFIEIFNSGTEGVDVADWQLTDGDALDTIVAWNPATHGELDNVVTQTSVIPAETYAVILDNNYLTGDQPYTFPAETIILTVGNTTIGNGLTAGSDPVTLYDNDGSIIDTYGTPLDETEPLDRDDDGLDDIPFDPGNGISVEKTDLDTGDSEDNWTANADGTATPGETNNPLVNYPPEIHEALASPSEVILNGTAETLLQVRATDPNGADDIASVVVDLSSVGGSANQEMSDIGEDWYNFELLPQATAGNYDLPVITTDSADETATASIPLTLITPEYPDTIVINELLPNPAATETEAEFIELYNSGNETVDLTGWHLTDGSRTYEMTTSLGAGQYQAFFNKDTSISLNNSGDEVQLLTPTSGERDRVGYTESADEETSYAREDSGTFTWTTTPTPNAANIFTGNENDPEESSSSSTSTTSSTKTKDNQETELSLVDISTVRTKDKNDEVKTKGIVISEPGMLSDKYFYIQDDKSGIQIYASDGSFPDLKLGDEIEVSGKLSQAQGEARINVKEGVIETVGQKEVPAAAIKATGEIQEEVEGMLVTTTGPVSRQSGQTFYLDDSSGEAKISIAKATGIEKPKMTKGDTVTITGIVGETKSGHRVLPRRQSDFGEGGNIAGASSDGKDKELPDAGPTTNLLILISVVISTAGLIIRKIWRPLPA